MSRSSEESGTEVKELIDRTEFQARRLSEFGLFSLPRPPGPSRESVLEDLRRARVALLEGRIPEATELAALAEGKLHDRLYGSLRGWWFRLSNVNQVVLIAWYLIVFLVLLNVETGFIASGVAGWFRFATEVWGVPTRVLGLGALGATLRGGWWLYRQTARGQYRPNFLASHLLAPMIGALFGFVTYLFLGAGLLALGGAGNAEDLDNALVPAALAFLAGYSWEWVLAWMDAFRTKSGLPSAGKGSDGPPPAGGGGAPPGGAASKGGAGAERNEAARAESNIVHRATMNGATAMQLWKTTILPTDDPGLARDILNTLIHEEPYVLAIVFGKGAEDLQLAQRMSKNAGAKNEPWWVVWARMPEHVAETVASLSGAPADLGQVRAVVLNLADTVHTTFSRDDAVPNHLTILTAFVQAATL